MVNSICNISNWFYFYFLYTIIKNCNLLFNSILCFWILLILYCRSRYDAEITRNRLWRQCITEDLPDAPKMYDWIEFSASVLPIINNWSIHICISSCLSISSRYCHHPNRWSENTGTLIDWNPFKNICVNTREELFRKEEKW